jgi:plastocyanin
MSRRLTAAVTAAATLVSLSCFSEREPAGTDNSGAGGVCQARNPQELVVPGNVIVVIKDFRFQPAEVRIRPGTTVTWVNCDNIGHTSTANAGGAWNSPLLNQGEAFGRGFAQAGRFGYHCAPHPNMTGTVVVEGP